jgi:hypothetical protein
LDEEIPHRQDRRELLVSATQDNEEIEVEFIDIEITEEQIEIESKAEKPRAHVVVVNLDDGETIRLWAAFDVKIEHVITRVYKCFDLKREPGDRLVRRDDQKDVFAEEQLTVRKYVHEHGGKAHIHWEFSGDTGGAAR